MTWSMHARFLDSRNKQVFILFLSWSLIQYCLISSQSTALSRLLSLQWVVPNESPANHTPCSSLGVSSCSVFWAWYPGPQFRNPLPRLLFLSAWTAEPLPPYWVFSGVATPVLSFILRISLLALIILSLELGNEAAICPPFSTQRCASGGVPSNRSSAPRLQPIADTWCRLHFLNT